MTDVAELRGAATRAWKAYEELNVSVGNDIREIKRILEEKTRLGSQKTQGGHRFLSQQVKNNIDLHTKLDEILARLP
jgi:hypothetical protein